MRYRVGTRASRLAMAQTGWVISELESRAPDAKYETVEITTTGDTDARPLFAIDQRGIFAKELDRAVAENRIDFAVHSMKDVPTDIPKGLTIACVPKREAPGDIMISKDAHTLESLPEGATVGTSSLRRAVQIRRARPDLAVRPVRGNIETRIAKVDDGRYDAIVLAAAGIARLGLDVKHKTLPFSPSPGQGALAIVCRDSDGDTIATLQGIQDDDSRRAAEAERAVSHAVDSGCRFPVGALATIDDNIMKISVHAFSVDGSRAISVTRTGSPDNPQELGAQAGQELHRQGINELAADWRAKVEEWNRQ